jgi:hypothetical protein
VGRQQEIEERLAQAGLPVLPEAEAPRAIDPDRQARLRRFRAVLADLGPVFTAFGRYLSTRLDVLSGDDSRELASLPDATAPMSEAALRARLQSELGPERVRYFAEIEGAPVEATAATQTHRARLSDGRTVAVRLARTDLPWDSDGALLPALTDRLAGLWPRPAIQRLIADFADLAKRQADRHREGAALRRLGRLPTDALRVTAPSVIETLSSERVLTLDPFETAPSFPASETPTAAGRHLADLWLHLVLSELLVPEDLSGGAVRVTTAGSLVITGGLFHTLLPEEGDALARYLVAAARDDPDGLFEALSVLTIARPDARPEAFRHRLGHVVPRRDGRFGQTPPGFPELLLSHWPQLERHGLESGPGLRAFYRGLVTLRDLMGPALSAGVLRDSHHVAHVWRGVKQLQDSLRVEAIARGAQNVAEAILNVSRSFEQRRAAERRGADPLPDPEPEQGRAGWAGLAAGLLLAATLTLWLYRLPAFLGEGTRWVLAAATTLVGIALLRAVWRR